MRTALRLGVALLLSLPAVAARAQGGSEEEPMPPSFQNLPAGAPSATPADVVSASPSAAPGSGTGEPDGYLPSLIGPIGLYHMSTAEVGPESHLRLALHGQYFKWDNFLISGDSDSRVDGAFTFGFTPHRYIEVFGALLTSSNRNRRVSETGRRDPELIKSFGDLVLGPKVVAPVAQGLNVGFELGLRFLSSISDLSFSPNSTSLWVGPLATLDLRPLAGAP
jgi:hypothetical protein